MPEAMQPSAPDLVDTFSHFDFSSMPRGDIYKILASVILPRPIAWVTTRDEAGAVNAAPYSFFNVLSSDPPLLAISFAAAPDREGKDTLFHIRQHGEFVVNMVPEELAEAMNITASNAPRGTDETQLAHLELTESTSVDVPRIAGSPVSLECKVFQILEPGGTSTIVLGRVTHVHIRTSAFEDESRLHIDPSKMRMIGRMHGAGGYCTTRDMFYIQRRSWPLDEQV